MMKLTGMDHILVNMVQLLPVPNAECKFWRIVHYGVSFFRSSSARALGQSSRRSCAGLRPSGLTTTSGASPIPSCRRLRRRWGGLRCMAMLDMAHDSVGSLAPGPDRRWRVSLLLPRPGTGILRASRRPRRGALEAGGGVVSTGRSRSTSTTVSSSCRLRYIPPGWATPPGARVPEPVLSGCAGSSTPAVVRGRRSAHVPPRAANRPPSPAGSRRMGFPPTISAAVATAGWPGCPVPGPRNTARRATAATPRSSGPGRPLG